MNLNKLIKIFEIKNIDRIPFRNDINGLRAIAVIIVVLYHADFVLFKGGWLGVDMFFVISGYLISNIIVSELNLGIFSFRKFYLRRIRRIVPALVFTLLFTIPFGYWLLSPKAMMEYVGSMLASLFFYANYYFQNLDFYNAEPSKFMPLLHTWSLAIEEQYYLIFPLIAYIFYKFAKKYFFHLITFLLIASIFLNSTTTNFVKFYQLQYRIWELLLGVLIMILSNNISIKHLEKIGMPLLLLPVFFFDDRMVNNIEPKLISLIGISLVIFSNSEETLLTKVLGHKIVYFIGISSFSIYLLHQPLFSFYRIFKNKIIFTDVNSIEKIVLIFLLLALGYLSWYLIEIPFQRNLKIYSFSIILFLAILSISAFAFFGLSSDGYSNRFKDIPNEALNKEFQMSSIYLYNEDGEICSGFSAFCEFENKFNKKIILIGDSQAELLQQGIYSVIQNDYSFVPLAGDKFFRCNFYKIDLINDCEGDEKKIFEEFIEKNKGSVYIFIASYDRYEQGWLKAEENFTNIFNKIISNENDLIVLNSVPFVYKNQDIKNLYNNNNFSYGELIGYNLDEWNPFRNKIIKFFEDKNLTLFIDPTDVFCNEIIENYCVNAFKDKIYFYDNVHLSHIGIDLLIQFLFKEIENNKAYLDNY